MKKLLFLSIFLVSASVFSQTKYAANRYFKEFNYPKAASLYTQMYKKGDESKLVLSRIADSYYYNVETKKAEPWYKLLIEKYPDIEAEYLFRYAQVLKSNGNYKLSDKYMLAFKKREINDNRSDALRTTPNYVEIYTKQEGDVLSVHNVSVNTKYSDFGGFGFKDTFYFASSTPKPVSKNELYVWNGQPFLDLYTSKIVEEGKDTIDLKGKELFGAPVETNYHESNAIITKDGTTMYFTRDNYKKGKAKESRKDGKINLKIYRATLKDGKWTDVTELPFNSDDYSVGHPALSPDEKTLYFASNMPGGFGYTDIYKVNILPGLKYGLPVNLGRNVNTKGREMFPFVSSNNALYFSSDGHLGLGALDIFQVKIKEDGSYGEAGNIKAPFNSKLDDFAFWINEDRVRGFFSSNRKGGKGDDDIYSFVLSRKDLICKQPLTGVVTDSKTGLVIKEALVKLLDKEGKVINTQSTDSLGVYTFDVNCKTSYKIIATKTDYQQDFKEFVTSDKNEEVNKVDLALTPLIVKDQIVINPIYFDFDKSNIRPDATYELEKIVTVMNNHPNMYIRIESHTDCRGTRNYNRALSDRRAKSTRRYLISRDIAPERVVSAIGYGEDRLLNHCDDAHAKSCTKDEHQLNRRSYFYIVKGGEDVEIVNQYKEKDTSAYHIVKKGETLFGISEKYGVSVAKLKKWNNLKDSRIEVYQKLRIKEK